MLLGWNSIISVTTRVNENLFRCWNIICVDFATFEAYFLMIRIQPISFRNVKRIRIRSTHSIFNFNKVVMVICIFQAHKLMRPFFRHLIMPLCMLELAKKTQIIMRIRSFGEHSVVVNHGNNQRKTSSNALYNLPMR